MARRTGESTRIIDNCIQELFQNSETNIVDGQSIEAVISTFNRFRRRLELEHPNTKYTYKQTRFDNKLSYKVKLHNL